MMAGAVGEAKVATPEVQDMCEKLKDSALKKAQETGWNGLFSEFTATSFSTQVVAGTNYFVKVKVGDGKFIHMRAFQPLPHTGQPAAVHSLQLDKAEADPLLHF
mmetsp:Transcript_53680/g.100603  ORF Transcript_53680/g.100603 Transcript_53680/m.100603 type:complete len:104 (-) Transcript_53680:53-364(-)